MIILFCILLNTHRVPEQFPISLEPHLMFPVTLKNRNILLNHIFIIMIILFILYIIKYPPCPRRVSYKPGTPARVSSSWRHPTAQLLPTTTF